MQGSIFVSSDFMWTTQESGAGVTLLLNCPQTGPLAANSGTGLVSRFRGSFCVRSFQGGVPYKFLDFPEQSSIKADHGLLVEPDVEFPSSTSGFLFPRPCKPRGVSFQILSGGTVMAPMACFSIDSAPAASCMRAGLEEQIVTFLSSRAEILTDALVSSA